MNSIYYRKYTERRRPTVSRTAWRQDRTDLQTQMSRLRDRIDGKAGRYTGYIGQIHRRDRRNKQTRISNTRKKDETDTQTRQTE